MKQSIKDFDHRSIPMTEAKRFIQNMSQPPFQEFIESHFRLINHIRRPVLKEMWRKFEKDQGYAPCKFQDFRAFILSDYVNYFDGK